MRRVLLLVVALLAPVWATVASAAAPAWVEGKDYVRIQSPRQLGTRPGKIVVTEVFSYACPACNAFRPVMNRIRAALPPNGEIAYVPASFRPDEDWPMFQKAFYAAQALGIDKQTHDAMFDAVWKTGELATMQQDGRALKVPAPSIQDAAKFYARVAGVKPEAFLAAAQSFDVDRKCREADDFLKAFQVLSTPTVVVNGKYRVESSVASGPGGYDKLIELVKWLVAQEHP
ncbi:MAG: thiol:disulfide interchange protein DsbA/DsbL [Proteobacteria bacterium]|nr:thiol:disulfide interchange protein DsbA/DsbL [Pseudomonadota bacterium]